MGELLHEPHVYRGLANGPSPRRGSKEGPWKGCIILDQWDRFDSRGKPASTIKLLWTLGLSTPTAMTGFPEEKCKS